jgi:hypothetical protein
MLKQSGNLNELFQNMLNARENIAEADGDRIALVK